MTLDEQQSVLCELAGIDAPPSITAPAIDQDDYDMPRLYTGSDSRPQPARPPYDDPFGFLANVDCHSLLRLLADEGPQTIALVASHVPSVYGAEMISGLAPERQLAVIRAVASQEPTDPEIVRIVRVLEDAPGRWSRSRISFARSGFRAVSAYCRLPLPLGHYVC